MKMKEYPSIPAAASLLARSEAYLGRPFVAFDKLDGSNIRAEWNRRKGWHRFGSRRRLLGHAQPFLSQAIRLILEGYADGLARAFTDDPALCRPQQATVYFELLGPHSFAGIHDPRELDVPSNEPLRVVLIDVNLHKRGLMSAEDFIERFGRLGIPAVVHRGELTPDFIAAVRSGRFGTAEGVVCKGGAGHRRWMAKIKTDAYLRRLRAFFGDDWQQYGE
jgi:hypothetical protein